MRSSALALCVLFLPWTSAFKTTLRRVDTGRSAAAPRALYPVINAATADEDVDLVNSMNVVYMADITIGGVDYTVQLDSGSSDLWVRPKGTGTLTGATDTQLTYNITYSIGYAAGNIVTVPVEFAGYTVTSQAVLQVTSSNNPVFSFGADGILGLGFTSLSSVDRVVTAAGGDYGHDFLYNVFARNTSAPNFIAFQLERKNNLASDTDSIFAIGEIEDKYKGISQTQKISTWPVSSPKRWTVLLDGYEYADGIKRTLATKVDGAPSSVVLLDTGASYAYASEDLVTGLYGSVQGASFDSTMGMWVVPCNQEVNFALWIGGRKFDWDPLDVVVPSINDNTTCVGSIIPASLSGFDFHAGDTFLRSLYTVFDFGDFDSSGKMGDPYVRLWSLIDQPTASAEFHQIRGGTAQAYKSSSNADPNAASTTPDVPTNASSDNATSTDDEMAHNIKTLVSYAPIALGVLGLNALLLVVILALGLSFICKRKKKRIANRTSPAAGLSINSTLSRSHSYRQVKSEDVDTPMAQLNFADDPDTPHSMKKSHTSSYYAKGEALDSPVDGGDESPSAIRMSRISGHTHTPSKASFKPVPSSLSQTALPLSPSKNSTFADAQANAIPLPTSATSLVFPGDRAASPAAGSVGRAPSPLALSASKGATDLADVSLIDESDPQHPATPSIEVAPPSQQPSSRANEYLAAMEARRAALAGAGDARRNTYHDEQEEPLEPPRRFGPGGDGRRAMSGYYNNGAPTNLEPLQVPSRRPPPPPVDSPQDETSPHRDNNPSPPPSAGLAYSQEISMPPGPSRSQEYLAAMEARKGAMTESQESWQRNSLGPLQPPPRRLNSGDGRRATYNAQPAPGEGDRGTIYFDAPDTPVDGLSSPMHPRSGPYSPASPQAPSAHGRTGSTSSVSRGSPLKSSMKSPVRSTFNPTGQPPPPVPRSSSNLNPSSGLLPPRRPTDPQHARAGSYAGSSSVPRMTSNMAPPVRSAGWNPRAMPGEEEDLAEQRMDMSFEERVGMQADAFGDGQAPPRRPFAPTSAPGYRYSSAQ